jgi:hypothetical protein
MSSAQEPHVASTWAASALAYVYEQRRYGLKQDSEQAEQWRRRKEVLEPRPWRPLSDWFYE